MGASVSIVRGYFNSAKAPRMGPACAALVEVLDDGRWHSYSRCRRVMLGFGLAKSTVDCMLWNMVAVGGLRKRGSYDPKRRPNIIDTRQLILTSEGRQVLRLTPLEGS